MLLGCECVVKNKKQFKLYLNIIQEKFSYHFTLFIIYFDHVVVLNQLIIVWLIITIIKTIYCELCIKNLKCIEISI